MAASKSSFPEQPFSRTSLNIGFLLYPILLLYLFSVLIWKYVARYSWFKEINNYVLVEEAEQNKGFYWLLVGSGWLWLALGGSWLALVGSG